MVCCCASLIVSVHTSQRLHPPSTPHNTCTNAQLPTIQLLSTGIFLDFYFFIDMISRFIQQLNIVGLINYGFFNALISIRLNAAETYSLSYSSLKVVLANDQNYIIYTSDVVGYLPKRIRKKYEVGLLLGVYKYGIIVAKKPQHLPAKLSFSNAPRTYDAVIKHSSLGGRRLFDKRKFAG